MWRCPVIGISKWSFAGGGMEGAIASSGVNVARSTLRAGNGLLMPLSSPDPAVAALKNPRDPKTPAMSRPGQVIPRNQTGGTWDFSLVPPARIANFAAIVAELGRKPSRTG
jgi:hypothetical protein